MKTTNYNVKIDRKTHQLDATDIAVGRLATQISILLRGKNKVNYAPQVDNGDFVIVTNADKIKFTGNKINQKIYYRHSGYPGGIKETKLKDAFNKDPREVIKRTVINMLPKNRLRNNMIKRLTFK